MIYNLLLTAVRNLRKNKFFSLLNIMGLAIGMCVFLLIAQYVRFERSYENFIPDAENIYRVSLQTFVNKERILNSAENYPGVGPSLKKELPEVVSYARLYNIGYKNNVVITYKDAKPDPIAFKQRRFLYADSSFLPMMGYQLVKGNINTALAQPLSAVISEKYAKMYFKNEDPIGKTLLLQDDDFNNELTTITAVFRDLPGNTHLKFDVLFSYKTLMSRGDADFARRRFEEGWNRKDMYTFIQLRPGSDPKKVEAKFAGIVDKYKPALKEGQQKDLLSLQPLKDIHLYSDLAEEPEPNGNGRTVAFMAIIGIFVLVIAWINYVNLSTARALERAKEVGVRKVIGAFKRQLISQFLAEAALVNLLAVLIAWGLMALALPYFNTLSGLQLDRGFLVRPWFLALLFILWVAGIFLSGSYPALILSSFKPVTVLKGKMKNSNRGVLLRKGLVVTQFIASIALMAGTFIVYRQLKYMMNQDLGININQVLVVERPGIADTSRTAFNSAIDYFRDELKKSPSIESLSASLTVPGKQREYKGTIKRYGAANSDSAIMRVNSMDDDFINTFKMKLVAGRAFSRSFPRDEDTSVIITASAIKMLGFKDAQDAIGKTLAIPQFQWNPIIVGVVNDYHQVSLKKTLDPSIFYYTRYGGEFYSMHIRTDNLSGTLAHIEQSWKKAFPGNPFEYFFLDDYFNRQYENDRKFGKLFTTFALLAIFIGCLGLFGLSAYTATQRVKEIGIRKVLGASMTDITTMLSKDFLKLVLIAVVIALPVAWLVMHRWLQDFAYRVNLSWWVFAVAGIVALAIALLTISFQAVKAALANPVKSLRTE
jgi:putative ABC transport system permease protein